MTEQSQVCAMEGCDQTFVARSHNQIFCCKDHQRIVTNQKIKDNYHDRKARRNGQERLCERYGKTKLSRYNDSKICQTCATESREKRDTEAFEALSRVIT